MISKFDIKLNDEVELKKTHACGGKNWKIIRFGVDCKIECLTCGRVVLIERIDLKKRIKKILKSDIENQN